MSERRQGSTQQVSAAENRSARLASWVIGSDRLTMFAWVRLATKHSSRAVTQREKIRM